MIYKDLEVLFIIVATIWGAVLILKILCSQLPFSIVEFLNPVIIYFLGVTLNNIYPWLGTLLVIAFHLLLVVYLSYKHINDPNRGQKHGCLQNSGNAAYESIKERFLRYFPEVLICAAGFIISGFILLSKI